jgi:DNA-binding response OmpR family regulator
VFVPEQAIIPAELPSETTCTVLIADDDSNIRDFLQTILEREGYDVIQADSGDQTLAVAQTLQIDAFIRAVEMPPRIGGISLCRSLRAMEQLSPNAVSFF